MKRPYRAPDGKYHINGKTYPELKGSRIKVMNETAYKTEGGLKKNQLLLNKWGRIVSLKKHLTEKKKKTLLKKGYSAKKGQFGFVRVPVNDRKTRKSKK